MEKIWKFSARFVAILLIFLRYCECSDGCFFPAEYQGTYVSQYPTPGMASPMYSEVAILPDSVPVWGQCYKRVGNNVLLRDRTRSTDCIRCFRFTLRSWNVLQIHTEGLEKCYINEEAALSTCPNEASIRLRNPKEIILYRKPAPDASLQQTYCPINGRFKLSYSLNGGEQECVKPVSEISNCPYGFALSAKFRQCSFGDKEATYQCLADWDDPSGDRFLALLDIKSTRAPRYRCAMYREDPHTRKITMSISPDSTCTYQLKNSTHGYETFALTPVDPPSWPVQVVTTDCKFPDWAQGFWQEVVVEGHTMTYTDTRNFKSYTIRCLGRDTRSRQDRFRVYARTQCGDEIYNCLLMTYRGKQVMEFQLGQYPSLQYNESICSDEQFTPRNWITQGRTKVQPDRPCPISGDYTGIIPDATGLCARMSSDCINPQDMHYSVSNCENRTEVYEERKYRCLGEWEENGVMYTYTQRADLMGYQCFVGKIINNGDVFIKEAGEYCVRGIDPMKFGMKMSKLGECEVGADQPAAPASPPSQDISYPNYPEKPRTVQTRGPAYQLPSSTTTRPWRPITASPNEISPNSCSLLQPTLLSILVTLLIFITC